uniref:Emb/CAB87268.1 n=1 Tax=Arabidopsis thaliana TaxID=3702 RepID=Q9FHW3_ARATH|nr:unnamed protein product [Arabidopsis thaliana]
MLATTNVSTDVASMMLDGTVKIPKQLFGNGGASAMPVHELVQPARGVVEEDKKFLEKKEKMHDLEQQIINASQQDTLHEYFGMMKAVQDAFAEAASSKNGKEIVKAEHKVCNSILKVGHKSVLFQEWRRFCL